MYEQGPVTRGHRNTSKQETIAERRVEREMRERLRYRRDYWRAPPEQRKRIERAVRESILLRRYEDES